MTRSQQLVYLLRGLLDEQPRYAELTVPDNEIEQWALLRALMNVRPPAPASKEWLAVQDGFLQQEIRQKGVTPVSALRPRRPGLYLWQGDITTLAADAVVNAANSALLGCFVPNHGCIDNAIHTYAGVQLRQACHTLMQAQGHEEPTGQAKITPGFNLPCRFVLHTVGPIVTGPLTPAHRAQLADCYRHCLALAIRRGLRSVAFCCISTGEFHFPNDVAARIAVDTVQRARAEAQSEIKVIFNVFKQTDYELYDALLG